MTCDRCGKAGAVVHSHHLLEGREIALHWCAACAEALGVTSTPSLAKPEAADELEWLLLDAIDQPDRVGDAEEERTVRLISADVVATLGPGKEEQIRREAAQVRSWWHDPPGYITRVAEGVQQYLHDCFIDTTWPRCPRHGDHPLWLHDHVWRCERDGVDVAPLGELGDVVSLRHT